MDNMKVRDIKGKLSMYRNMSIVNFMCISSQRNSIHMLRMAERIPMIFLFTIWMYITAYSGVIEGITETTIFWIIQNT